MNKNIEWVFVLCLSMVLLFFGMLLLIIGRNIYGADASLLWASGILTYMGIRGLAGFILYLWKLKDNEGENQE